MDFLEVVGRRRSIRWFAPWRPVEDEKIQRILEAARLTGCPGNLQPWRAVVVRQRELDPEPRATLLNANNRQFPQVLAPIWIYWLAEPAAVSQDAFVGAVEPLIRAGALAPELGWSTERMRAALRDGAPMPEGLPGVHRTLHGMPPEAAAIVAAQETVGAATVANLAAVNEGLGSSLSTATDPASAAAVLETLGAPGWLPVWLQLVGYPAESEEAGGQRPRAGFESLFFRDTAATPFPRDPEVVGRLREEGLLRPPGPLPGRQEEIAHLMRMFAEELAQEERDSP